MSQPHEKLCRRLGYTFNDSRILREALTHRSASSDNNERLEFLGDAALNFIVASELFHRYPDEQEGSLSRLRARLVKGDTLASIAQELELGEFLTLGPGELKSGGYRRNSTLADALEAVIGAVYVDSGLEPCRRLILSIYEKQLSIVSPSEDLKDAKTRLQEYLQSRKLPLPEYHISAVEGEAHAQIFTVECSVTEGNLVTRGTGSSRRKAEQDAAQKAIDQLM